MHRDFGLLTALTHPIYFDLKGNLVGNIKSGLLIENKKNEIIKVEFEEDEMIMQTGDIFFIISGGNIIETPHSVKITEGIPDDIYRIKFVNFFDPYFDYKIYSQIRFVQMNYLKRIHLKTLMFLQSSNKELHIKIW
jgi:hypothetical protein